MKRNSPLFIFFLIAMSCGESRKTITRPDDYRTYLSYNQLVSQDPALEEQKFWSERLKRNGYDETSLMKLGALHAELFRSTGLADHILVSDSLYKVVLQKYRKGNVEVYHSLSANCIAQHKFQEAKDYAEKALALKDKKATSLLLLVDASLEVGDDATANRILRQFTNKNSFAYLIRKAKLKDHEGLLDSAILCMEKAYERIKGNKKMAPWALSNLGDMYGHAGRIEDSYAAYLEALQNNPQDDHSLKGIAWIAISHDHNTSDAKIIINALAVRKRMPEAHLMLAEIAVMEGNEREKLLQLKKFKSIVSDARYKTMYNKYLAVLKAEEFGNAADAVLIAEAEIVNRPTPESYDLLAWSYYHQGKFEQALDIVSHKVENQTFEPESLYHIGMIYQANGNKEKAQHYLTQALESEFELGPSRCRKIKNVLQYPD